MAENNKDKLPHLASQIKSGLDLAENGKQDRINGLVQAAIALHEARSLIKADVRFSKWCTDNAFGPDVLNAHDRAALIAMGADPERMRSLLTNSERQSARYVYQHEWSAAEAADDADAAAGASADGDADTAAGASADADADADPDANAGADADDPSENRFAYADKPEEAQQKQQFRGAGHTRRSERVKPSIFTIAEFKLIRMCLHPDGERTKEMKNKALVLFNSKQFVLTGVR
jgi:hypothetical protein